MSLERRWGERAVEQVDRHGRPIGRRRPPAVRRSSPTLGIFHMTGERMTASELIATYIRAKDSNRAHLMTAAFAPNASLEMVVNARTISFPPHTTGIDAITSVLVSPFGQTFENVYTFCLCAPPNSDPSAFSCAWLVGMSEKDGGAVRVGSGRYDWMFGAGDTGLVVRLKITIEHMQTLPSSHLPTIMSWLSRLPYPWCSADAAVGTMPQLSELQSLAKQLREMEK